MVRVKSTLWAMLSDGSVMAAVDQITITRCAVLDTWQLCIYHCIYAPQQPRKESCQPDCADEESKTERDK